MPAQSVSACRAGIFDDGVRYLLLMMHVWWVVMVGPPLVRSSADWTGLRVSAEQAMNGRFYIDSVVVSILPK